MQVVVNINRSLNLFLYGEKETFLPIIKSDFKKIGEDNVMILATLIIVII